MFTATDVLADAFSLYKGGVIHYKTTTEAQPCNAFDRAKACFSVKVRSH